jgi:hypothetical protein
MSITCIFRPRKVEALHWTGFNVTEAVDFMEEHPVALYKKPQSDIRPSHNHEHALEIQRPDYMGTIPVAKGAYVVKLSKGNFAVYSEKEFQKTFMVVED